MDVVEFEPFNPISTRLVSHPICTGGGKFAPLFLSKNCLVSDRSKIFCSSKLFLLNCLNKNFEVVTSRKR